MGLFGLWFVCGLACCFWLCDVLFCSVCLIAVAWFVRYCLGLGWVIRLLRRCVGEFCVGFALAVVDDFVWLLLCCYCCLFLWGLLGCWSLLVLVDFAELLLVLLRLVLGGLLIAVCCFSGGGLLSVCVLVWCVFWWLWFEQVVVVIVCLAGVAVWFGI